MLKHVGGCRGIANEAVNVDVGVAIGEIETGIVLVAGDHAVATEEICTGLKTGDPELRSLSNGTSGHQCHSAAAAVKALEFTPSLKRTCRSRGVDWQSQLENSTHLLSGRPCRYSTAVAFDNPAANR